VLEPSAPEDDAGCAVLLVPGGALKRSAVVILTKLSDLGHGDVFEVKPIPERGQMVIKRLDIQRQGQNMRPICNNL
jgi:hypothetical protein